MLQKVDEICKNQAFDEAKAKIINGNFVKKLQRTFIPIIIFLDVQ